MLYFCHRVNRIHVHLTTSEPGTGSVDLGLVARAVLDALRIKVLLDVFGNSTLDCDRIQPPHVFIYTAQTRLSRVGQKKKREHRTNLFFANAPPSSSLGSRPRRSHRNESSCRPGYDPESPSSKNQRSGPPSPFLDGRFYLHDLLAVRTAVAPEVYGCLYNRAEETGA